jgi:oligosaccharide repeat unit polymerase
MLNTILVLVIGTGGVLLSRKLLGRWFNHLSIYSIAWSMVLAAHEAGFVSYYPIDAVTWGVIVAGAVSFFLGSILVVLVQRRRVNRGGRLVPVPSAEAKVRTFWEAPPNQRALKWGILILSGISLLGVAQNLLLLGRFWSGLDRALRFGSDVYLLARATHPVEGQVPYLSVAAVAACSFAGLYAGRGRVSIILFLPFALLLLDALRAMGSATFLLAAILFVCSYLLVERKRGWKRVTVLLLLAASMLGVMLLIRRTRGAPERYGYESQALVSVSRALGGGADLYNYLSLAPGVLNEFLRSPYESDVPGSLTFGAVFRVLGHFNLTGPAPRYGVMYRTPVRGNVGTYLLPLYADFGMSGILLGPFILGVFCAWLWSRFKVKPTLTQVILISHAYALVAISPILNCLGDWGSWGVSLSFGLLTAWAIEARGRSQLRRSPAATTKPRVRGAGASSRSLLDLTGSVHSKGKIPGSQEGIRRGDAKIPASGSSREAVK